MKKITWLGHAAFMIETGETIVLLDPWIEGNPKSPLKSFKEIKKADLVFVTHDHADHGFTDAVNICKNTGATLVAPFELSEKGGKEGVNNIAGGNIGGEITVGKIRIYFAHAIHSSEIATPCGYVIIMPELTIYHTGDTAFYSDMEYLSKLYQIDVMLLPICSGFMMGPQEAAWAVEKVKPQMAIPCHYDTFPFLEKDPQEFKELVGSTTRVVILEIGKTFEL